MKYVENGAESIDELYKTFDTVGRSSPAVVDSLITDIIRSLAGRSLSDADVDAAVKTALKYVNSVLSLNLFEYYRL